MREGWIRWRRCNTPVLPGLFRVSLPPGRRARVQRRALRRGLGLCSHVELTGVLRSLSIARCALRRRG